MDKLDKEALSSNYKGMDNLDKEALGLDEDKKCPYCGNPFDGWYKDHHGLCGIA